MGKYDKYCNKFGYAKLRPLQHQIIDAILADKCDVIGIMSTGYGKSTCYQLPFEAIKGTQCILVICPLIALMEDQVASLTKKGIISVALNSNMNMKQRDTEMSIITMGINKIIYMSPEFCMSQREFLNNLYLEDRLLMIAIDEAHCISSWGNDFRGDYRSLSCFKEWFPETPIMALTATATSKVREDIAINLNLGEYYEYVSSFDRPNIYIDCRRKSNAIEDLRPLIKEHGTKQTIVYVRTRDMTIKISEKLNELGINSKPYHGGLPKEERQETFEEFVSGRYKWIVATVALGMGIDQNIPLVIHYGAPGDLSTYYQEIGRAGRNGEEAKCILFYGPGDMRINRIFLKDIENAKYKKNRETQIDYMEYFLKSTECRRKLLLQYFGEEYPHKTCDNCDNCCAEKVDETIEMEMQNALQYPLFLFRIFLLKSQINAGLGKFCSVLLGKGGKKTADFSKSPFYGSGKRYDEKMWHIAYETSILNEYIQLKTIGFGQVIESSNKLLAWYRTNMIHFKKLKSFTFDEYLTIAYDLKEDFIIPHGVEIMKYHNKRSISISEELALDKNDDYVVPTNSNKQIYVASKWNTRVKKTIE